MARFVADRMIERLARWMRLLGEDVEPPPASAAGFLEAARGGRIVLTRDTRLCAALARERLPFLFIRHDRIGDQLTQVDAAFPLGTQTPLSRCSRCNTPLVFLPGEDAGEAVWPHVRRTQATIGRCSTCGRHYWKASHTGRMEAFLRRVLGRDLLDAP